VKDFIRYVHIKDARLTEKRIGFSKAVYTFAGEGDGKVREIVGDLLKNGYDGGFSMEPHMGSVFHDTDNNSADDKRKEIYIEYGRRFEKLIEELSPVK
jgi:sugar phosphate isomerase/epimerase